jgi:hypothetical protein
MIGHGSKKGMTCAKLDALRDTNKVVKCTAKAGGYAETLCDALNSVGDTSPRKQSKGIFFGQMVNFETGEDVGVRVIIKQGNHQANGLVLNNCPFCGGELHDKH